jgi:RimJ/RimL family protein N-acetyltransferase
MQLFAAPITLPNGTVLDVLSPVYFDAYYYGFINADRAALGQFDLYPRRLTPKQALADLKFTWRQIQNGLSLSRSLWLHGRLIGQFGFRLKPPDHSAELGFGVHSQFHGRGYASTALTYIMTEATNLGYARFWFGTHLLNLPAQRLGRRLGFTQTSRNQLTPALIYERHMR